MIEKPSPKSSAAWQFFQTPDLSWRWRCLSSNGVEVQTSELFDTFGKCVRDAIAKGFTPDREPYSTRSGDWTASYRPPKTSVRPAGGGEDPKGSGNGSGEASA